MLKYTCKYWNILAPLVKKSLNSFARREGLLDVLPVICCLVLAFYFQ